MRAVLVLTYNTLLEQWRGRSYQTAMAFAGVMLYLSILMGMLAVDQELRALLDFGLGFIELMALAAAVFGAATVVLREIETKAVYLVLTRPVSRLQYLLGRYLGLTLSMCGAVALMSAFHVTILLAKGWEWRWAYALAASGVILKVAMATSLAMALALFSTSALSALTITGIVWTLGHFTEEMRFLLGRGGTPVWPLAILTKVLPNLQLLNFRDRLDVPASVWGPEAVGLSAAYAFVYSAAWLVLAFLLIRRKDL